MESIKVKSNKVAIAINEDENRIIEINPGDAAERKKYYDLFETIKKKEKELKTELKGKDTKELFNIDEKIFDEFAVELDKVFGEGTTAKITEGTKDLDMLAQFCEGLAPYFQRYSSEKIAKYGNRAQRRSGVMK